MANTASFKQIQTDISHKELASIYLLTGNEPYYIDSLTKIFEQEVIPQEAQDFNLSIFYGKDVNISTLISQCRQYPWMSEKRLVILKEAQMLDKRHFEELSLYLKTPNPTTVFVICNKTDKFDTKTKNVITKSSGVVFESKQIPDYKLSEWIETLIKSKKYTCEADVPTILAEYLGNNLQKIDNEVIKMIINLKDTTYITTDNVKELIGISKEYNVFALQNALAKKDIQKANTIIDYFSKNPKNNPIQQIIPILFAFYSKCLVVSQSVDKTSSTVAKLLGINPYSARDYVEASKYYSMPQLFAILSFLEEYDVKSKGVDVSPLYTEADLMKELVYKILHI
ncbi:MAG: DNA polymerase III subunit delta [Bacteroidales bacterium]|nr:DNA polymerase III subunit delta [Bacteroidales bacterium]